MLVYNVYAINDEIDFEICIASTRDKAIELVLQFLLDQKITPENIIDELCYDIYIREYEIDTLLLKTDVKNERNHLQIITPEIIERYQHMNKTIS